MELLLSCTNLALKNTTISYRAAASKFSSDLIIRCLKSKGNWVVVTFDSSDHD